MHILNPFLIHIFFQDWKKTLISFLSWEAIEVALLVLFHDYSIFAGDDSGIEPISDSLVGDPLNGLLGLLLAFTFGVATKMPYWNMSCYGPAKSVFWRQFIGYSLIGLSFSIYNANYQSQDMEVPFRFGVFLTASAHLVILLGLWLFRSDAETRYVWEGHERHRNKAYIGLMAITMLFHSLGGTYFLTFAYYQAWATWGVCMAALLLYTAAQGRLWEYYYYVVTWNISIEPLEKY